MGTAKLRKLTHEGGGHVSLDPPEQFEIAVYGSDPALKEVAESGQDRREEGGNAAKLRKLTHEGGGGKCPRIHKAVSNFSLRVWSPS